MIKGLDFKIIIHLQHMFKAQINTKSTIKLSPGSDQGTWLVDGDEVHVDRINVNDYAMHVLINNKSYRVNVLEADRATKTFVFKINNQKVEITLKDKYDELLHQLGMDATASAKQNDLKAPMPGLVVDVFVDKGQGIKKGDALLVLEAMKMENILKSDADGIVKKVEVSKGSKVEKNEVLVHFE
ncbi:MAG: biotin/lipoyl-binding protein [Bacteroidia bacterium]|nr:biotin/lipoyl-binding protein [Bacteroidia bacterium]NNC84812.1 biotin/lipoyl-binding protein [Bacteroidia bacterium]NNM16162.1 biotin/lipoyl-binding protein [Bacteroidia bacterium]